MAEEISGHMDDAPPAGPSASDRPRGFVEAIGAHSDFCTSAKRCAVTIALAKAQSEITDPEKSATADVTMKSGGKYQFQYATLEDGLKIIRPVLSKHNLAFIQTTRLHGDLLLLITRVMHSSGEWVQSEYPVAPLRGQTQQILGGALTYARRYSLFALVGIAPEDDDDANKASGEEAHISRTRQPDEPKQEDKRTAKTVYNKIRKAIESAPDEPNLDTTLRDLNNDLNRLKDVSESHYEELIDLSNTARDTLRQQVQ